MDLTKLLSELNKMKEKNEKQTDIYIDAMKEFIKSEAGNEWNSNHREIFETMKKRVHDARIYKWIISFLVFIVAISIIYFGLNSALFSTKIKQNMALVELARQSTLPLEIVKLDSSVKWLNVRIADQFNDLSGGQRENLRDLVGTFPSLGRLYGLSDQNELTVTLIPSNLKKEPVLLVRPDESSDVIGRLELASQLGKIWPNEGINSIDARQQFPLIESIEYLDESGIGLKFFIRINKFVANSGRWEVQFREGNSDWSNIYKISRTIRGIIESPIFIVYENGWDNIYAITLGIGSYGSSESKEFAWFVKSFAKRIYF